MPKRTDIKKHPDPWRRSDCYRPRACEFDYSGAQACKALREEGYRVIW